MPLFEVHYRLEGVIEIEADDYQAAATEAYDAVQYGAAENSHNTEAVEIIEIEDLPMGYPSFNRSLNSWAQHCAEAAKANGWTDHTLAESLLLIHSEVSEATEEMRNGKGTTETYYNPEKPGKPEGIPSELADIVIRVFHLCGKEGIDLDSIVEEKLAYNATRGYKHGGKVI